MQEAEVYAPDGPIRCRKRRYILTTDQSDTRPIYHPQPNGKVRHGHTVESTVKTLSSQFSRQFFTDTVEST
eukprot:6279400-Pyramimonas_sp.AAC.1